MEKQSLVEKLKYIEGLEKIVPEGVPWMEMDKYKRKTIEDGILKNPILLKKYQRKSTILEETERLTSHCKGKGLFLSWKRDEKQMGEVEKMHELTGLDKGFQKKGIWKISNPFISSLVFFALSSLIMAGVICLIASIVSIDGYPVGIPAIIIGILFPFAMGIIGFVPEFFKRTILNKRKKEAAYLDQEINRLSL